MFLCSFFIITCYYIPGDMMMYNFTDRREKALSYLAFALFYVIKVKNTVWPSVCYICICSPLSHFTQRERGGLLYKINEIV